LRQGDWKLVRNSRRNDDGWELFDLADDVSESKDLSSAQPDRFEQMMAVWRQMNGQMVEPAWR
jgi:arylsulfatase A-like enzyme